MIDNFAIINFSERIDRKNFLKPKNRETKNEAMHSTKAGNFCIAGLMNAI